MSGNFTQRGELAIADKYERAKWAIKYGADLVIEIPTQYVLASAEYFALGAIKIANAIKGEKILSFGSETEDLESLKKVASFKENEEFGKALNFYLKQGFGYAKSFSLALKESSADYAEILSSPNNILAIEYLKAIEKNFKATLPPSTSNDKAQTTRTKTILRYTLPQARYEICLKKTILRILKKASPRKCAIIFSPLIKKNFLNTEKGCFL